MFKKPVSKKFLLIIIIVVVVVVFLSFIFNWYGVSKSDHRAENNQPELYTPLGQENYPFVANLSLLAKKGVRIPNVQKISAFMYHFNQKSDSYEVVDDGSVVSDKIGESNDYNIYSTKFKLSYIPDKSIYFCEIVEYGDNVKFSVFSDDKYTNKLFYYDSSVDEAGD